jgi:hypothetical protein
MLNRGCGYDDVANIAALPNNMSAANSQSLGPLKR